MKIKVDEDLPNVISILLREAGQDAVSVREQKMNGWKDHRLWDIVQQEGRFLITADKGFGDLRTYSPGTHYGVLILRPDEDGIRPVVDLLGQVMKNYALDDFHGSLVVATPRSIRIRHG